jgi:hypothetical protein
MEKPHNEQAAPCAVVKPHDDKAEEDGKDGGNAHRDCNLWEQHALVRDPPADKVGGQVHQREDGCDQDAGPKWPMSPLQFGLQVACPADLFWQVGV